MAKGRIILPAPAWVPLDGSPGNLGPVLDFVQSSGGPPGPRFARWIFESDDSLRWLCATFRLPDDYAGTPAFVFDWYAPTHGYEVFPFKARVAAVSEGDGLPDKAPDSSVSAAAYPFDLNNDNRLNQDTIDLAASDDGLAADDLVMLMFGRDDTGEGESAYDAYFLGGCFEYATS